jgi:hypothetical protein
MKWQWQSVVKFLSRARCFCYSLKVTNERNHAHAGRQARKVGSLRLLNPFF